jgi:hypothetical protein
MLTNVTSWAHEICSSDNEERALVVGSMNEMAYVFQAWLPQVVWQQVDAPQYRKGFITGTVMGVLLIITTLSILWLERWENGKKVGERYVLGILWVGFDGGANCVSRDSDGEGLGGETDAGSQSGSGSASQTERSEVEVQGKL